MKKYHVVFTRNVEQTASLYVEAGSPDVAKRKALKELNESDWETTDVSGVDYSWVGEAK
jgi:DNA-dependent RNA polymerase auxiliary subunit epsilon